MEAAPRGGFCASAFAGRGDRLLQVVGQQLHDALGDGRGFGCAVGIEHGHRGAGVLAAEGLTETKEAPPERSLFDLVRREAYRPLSSRKLSRSATRLVWAPSSAPAASVNTARQVAKTCA
mgnify:CR=1 FL=1